ncbi:hypothetical protein [Mesorhizobium cantuariense]|uniref:Uncharacterized protein n=1 Tax=Mesorhizobium cantuariense TaxID=1300275 RepID=A0ABV7MQT7_9HYPH
MNIASLILRELIGMFVDDEFLALAVVAVVAIAGLLAWLAVPQFVVGGLLLAGCVVVVMSSALQASRKAR